MNGRVDGRGPDAPLEMPLQEALPGGLVARRGIWVAIVLFICSLAALAAWDLGMNPAASSTSDASGLKVSRSRSAGADVVGPAPSPRELQQVIDSQSNRTSVAAPAEAVRASPVALPSGPVPPELLAEGSRLPGPRAGDRSAPLAAGAAGVERVAEASVSGIFSIAEGNGTGDAALLAGRRAPNQSGLTAAEAIAGTVDPARRYADAGADAMRLLATASLNPQQPMRASRDESWLREYAQGRPADAAFAEDPASPWLIFQGTRIPVVTREALNSDLPGQVTALSTAPVFDSIRQCTVLIPQGARFIGQYSSDIRAGQSRMLLAFRRMILPDGRSVQLNGSPAVDPAGPSGASGDVDTHFLQMFGYGFAIAWIADRLGSGGSAVTVTQPNGQSTSTTVAGQVLADTSTRILNRNAVIPPTLTIEAGARMFVTVTRDLALNPVSKGGCL